jgi:integrase
MQGTIIKRGQTWTVVLDVGKDPQTGKRKRAWRGGYRTKKEAALAQVKLLQDLHDGAYVTASKETLAEYLERWVRDYVAHSVAPSARLRYTRIVRTQIVPQLGSVLLQDLRASHILAAQGHWLTRGRLGARAGTPLSPQTVKHHHRVLDQALAQAVKWGDLARNPMAGVDAPRVERTETRTLDLTQTQRWLAYVAEREHGLLLTLAYYTGMRLGEILGLRWTDVDLDAGALLVSQQYDKVAQRFRDTKSHRGRRPIALPEVLVQRLREARCAHVALLAEHPELWRRALVFEAPLGGPLSDDHIRRWHYRHLQALGLPRVRLHDLRHSHATHLINGGADLSTVSARLGHATPAFTLSQYGHLLPGADRQAVDRLAARLQRG